MYLRYHISSYFNFLYMPWHWGNQIYRYFRITHLFNPQSAFVILTKMFKIICINANTEICLRKIKLHGFMFTLKVTVFRNLLREIYTSVDSIKSVCSKEPEKDQLTQVLTPPPNSVQIYLFFWENESWESQYDSSGYIKSVWSKVKL